MRKWISVFGVMEMLHSDGGKEFNNEELSTVAGHLKIKPTYTAPIKMAAISASCAKV